jgi:putative ABC transport system permease protein
VNLTRRKLRLLLLFASVLVAFFLFGVLGAFGLAFENDGGAASRRLVVMSRISIVEPLPFAYVARVRALDGVSDATFVNWFGGYYQDERSMIPSFAVDPSTYLNVYSDVLAVTPEARHAFETERSSAIVGEELARQYDWHAGQHIALGSSIYVQSDGSRSWDFTIAGIAHAKNAGYSTNFLILPYAYFDDSRILHKHTVGWMVITATPGRDIAQVASTVDAAFANSPDETRTQTEQSFAKAFAAQIGNLTLAVKLIIAAAFFSLCLLFVNATSMSVRERTKEIGVLKALGFSRQRLTSLLFLETLCLTLAGGVAGLGLASLAVSALSGPLSGIAPGMCLTPALGSAGIVVAIAIGVLAALPPSLTTLRLSAASAFGRE